MMLERLDGESTVRQCIPEFRGPAAATRKARLPTAESLKIIQDT